ncbi:uncharacterized protein LOC129708942 [Leucoraja erinacea]|uniref:uncharacterized protein LOC129708942 n=1 Tax=Leucoraja erinaceus TaxID=7782 RepID=UPI002456E94B|nr:uncharacterized protein LOC129708942 [Leucoraja erinacea]
MAGDENKTDPVTLCGDSGAGNQPCGSFKCLNMGLQRWIGFMVLVEMVWQVSATGTGPISREWGEEANLPGWNAREPRQVNKQDTPECGAKPAAIKMKYTDITARKSGSATLPCKVPTGKDGPKTFVVTWSKGSGTLGVLTEGEGANYPGGTDRWRFMNTNVVETRDASLIITSLRETDIGIYSCAWFTGQKECRLNIKLTVN